MSRPIPPATPKDTRYGEQGDEVGGYLGGAKLGCDDATEACSRADLQHLTPLDQLWLLHQHAAADNLSLK